MNAIRYMFNSTRRSFRRRNTVTVATPSGTENHELRTVTVQPRSSGPSLVEAGGLGENHGNQNRTPRDARGVGRRVRAREGRVAHAPPNRQGRSVHEVRIPIEDDPVNEKGPSRYFTQLMDSLYYLGCITFQLLTNPPNGWKQRIFAIVNNFIFWSFHILSAFQSVCFTKDKFLLVVSEGGYKNSALFAMNAAWILAKVYATYILSTKKDQLEKMLISMQLYEKTYHIKKHGSNCGLDWMLIPLLVIATVILGVIRALYTPGADSITEIILISSQELSEDIFIWSANDTTTSAILELEYGTNLTPLTVVMGLIVIFRDIASNIQTGMILNVVLVLGLVIYSHVHAFMEEVKEVTPNAPKADVEACNALQKRRETTWERYRMLRDELFEMNEVFDPLYKLLHPVTLLSFAYLLVLIIYNDSTYLTILFYSIKLILIEIWYLAAGDVAEQNFGIRKWLRNWSTPSGKFLYCGQEMDLALFLDELDTEPIGFGKRKFVIHETFQCKLFALVGSLFFSMADEESRN